MQIAVRDVLIFIWRAAALRKESNHEKKLFLKLSLKEFYLTNKNKQNNESTIIMSAYDWKAIH